MQIKTPTIYAIQALREYQKATEILSTVKLAERLDISIAYATKVNYALVRGGFIEGTRGGRGGYTLAKDLSKTPITEFIRAVDEGLLEEEPGETKDMRTIRRKLQEALGEKGWGEPVSKLL